MEPILGSSVCLICFEMTEKHIFVPSDAPEKLFISCNKYLHSTLTKGTLKDIKLRNENQVPLCKKCFDAALELTQLSEQLTTIQKDISDLTVTFSMEVFHRRSQVYSIGQSCQTLSIVEFNEACLPSNLFSMKQGDQNIHQNKFNQEMDIDGLSLQTDIDITNVKCEGSDIQFDNLSGNPQQSVAKDDVEIQFNQENVDKEGEQCKIVDNQNLACVNEMEIVDKIGRNDTKTCADPNNGVKLTMSDLLKSVKMPKIILERIKIVRHMLNVSVGNSSQSKCESRKKNLDQTLFKDDELSVHSCAPKSPENFLKCLYCKKTFAKECHRTLHHKTHTEDKRPLGKQKFVYTNNQKICHTTPTGKKCFYKCSYCEKEFSFSGNLKLHERTHTGEKPYKCSFCNIRFKQSSNLKRHERTHTGEKPFKCSFCNNRFTSSSHMKSHERTHTGEKPFKCSFCNNRFNSSGDTKRHERTHTGEKPFKCSFCNSRFNRRIHLKQHERIHTGEKPFQCSFCVKRFNEKSNLKVHERMHTKEKPYKCLYCEKTFSKMRSKKSHQKCHPEQISSLVSQFDNQKEGSLGHLKHPELIHSAKHMQLKCSFCEMTFSHDEERAIHEKIHGREDEIVNENFIVGI